MRKARLHWHFLRRDSYLRFPLNGNLLEALDEGRAEIGPWVLIERGCWFTLHPETASIAIGEGTILNLGCMIAAAERIEIGAHCMFANHCFVSDADHRFDDPDVPITWQGSTAAAGQDRRQLLVRRELRGDRRRHDRRPHGGGGELGRDEATCRRA